MSFAEILLRLGVTFVSWLVIYMHLIMLFAGRYAQCPDTNAWRVSLVSAVFAFGASFAVNYGHGVHGSASTFRYFALPLAVLVPWAAWVCLPYFAGTTVAETGLCEVLSGMKIGTQVSAWQRAWAPVQLLVLGAIALNAWKAWASKPQDIT